MNTLSDRQRQSLCSWALLVSFLMIAALVGFALGGVPAALQLAAYALIPAGWVWLAVRFR